MNSISNKLKSQNGSVFITVLVLLIIFILMLGLVSDITKLYAVKIAARHSLNLSLRAASSQIDMAVLADVTNPRVQIIPAQAEEIFQQNIRDNLRLNASYDPLSNSMADGRVEVCCFYVVNSPPYNYTWSGYSETIHKVSSTAIIKVPVKMSVLAQFVAGMPEVTDLYVHSTVGPELNHAP